MIQKFDNKNSVALSDFDGLFLGLSNGDKTAIEEAMKRWHFKDIESLVRYALAVFIKAEKGKLITEIGGNQINLVPNDSLLSETPSEKSS